MAPRAFILGCLSLALTACSAQVPPAQQPPAGVPEAAANSKPESATTQGEVKPEELVAIVGRADRIEVFSDFRDPEAAYRSQDAKDIAALAEAVRTLPPDEFFHCMCDGTPVLHLYRGQERLVTITNHHGRSLRCSLWKSDAMLAQPERLLEWFDARNMPAPRKEVNEMAEQERQSRSARDRWLAAVPKSLAPHQKLVMRPFPDRENLDPLRMALAKEFPEKKDRILALFAWYGSGEGPWSGFASYESLPEALLLEESTADLLNAAQGESLSPAQLEGAARLFGGWTFSQVRREDREALPAELKRRLLAHSLKNSKDEDRIGRAKSAFGEKK